MAQVPCVSPEGALSRTLPVLQGSPRPWLSSPLQSTAEDRPFQGPPGRAWPAATWDRPVECYCQAGDAATESRHKNSTAAELQPLKPALSSGPRGLGWCSWPATTLSAADFVRTRHGTASDIHGVSHSSRNLVLRCFTGSEPVCRGALLAAREGLRSRSGSSNAQSPTCTPAPRQGWGPRLRQAAKSLRKSLTIRCCS